MNTRAEKKPENKSDALNNAQPLQGKGKNGLGLIDNRAKTIQQRQLLQTINTIPRTAQMKNAPVTTKATASAIQLKAAVPVNDNPGLEKEADIMGSKALQTTAVPTENNNTYQPAAQRLHNTHKTAQAVAVAQLIPDKTTLYFNRLRQRAGLALIAPGPPLYLGMANYAMNPANVAIVGQNVMNAMVAAFGAGAVPTIGLLTAAITAGLAVNVAGPGQYVADTAYNADLTGVLMANPFIQSVVTGALHALVPTHRGTPPAPAPVAAAGGIVPAAHSLPLPGADADDRVLETTDLFNRLTNIPQTLPPVVVNSIWGPHAAMGENGDMDLGWAAARGNILHEFGHHLENNLGPADFVTVHNFLTARTRLPAGHVPGAAMPGMVGMRPRAGYFFENHPGYNIDMPAINAGDVPRRPISRYARFFGSALKQQLGKLVSLVSRRRGPRNWGAQGIENFFVHNANNQNLSYSTAVHEFGTPFDTGTTEYTSTTVEFFNKPAHAQELVNSDPLRAALFLYLGNRPQYALVRLAFNALPVAGGAPPRPDLNDLIHAVQ